MSVKMTGSELFDSQKRFSVAMWDDSWLYQRWGRQNEYRDWDKVLDELKERGYDCIRIDAEVHFIAKDRQGITQDEFEVLAVPNNMMWGCHKNMVVNLKESIINFMKKAKDKGIYVALSAWYMPDTSDRRLMIKSPEDFSRVWIETLDILDKEELLDIVVWVDICNEFPLTLGCPYPRAEILGIDPLKTDEEAPKKWNTDKLSEYFVNSIAPIKAAYPDLKYTFSAITPLAEEFMKGDTSLFDLAEPHIWATDDKQWSDLTDFRECHTGLFPEAVLNFSRKATKFFPEYRQHIYNFLDMKMDLWAAWAKERNLPLVTTEAWTSVLYEDLSHCGFMGEWDWFMEVAEMGVELAVKKGWKGICTSNFCEPHFEGMWYDIDWHKKMNDMIHNG